MLPCLWVYRGANFTGSQVDDVFGNLKTGLKIKTLSRWVGLAVGIFLVVLGLGFFWFKLRKASDVDEYQEALVYA
jgi:uncharacterized membrane protein